MTQNKLSGYIGLCKKSGKLTVGTDLVIGEIRKNRKAPFLVLLANNASDNTEKKVRNCCVFYGKQCMTLPFGREELGHLLGKTGAAACVAVNDEGFAKAMIAAGGIQTGESISGRIIDDYKNEV